ncbi:hypothetical protein BDZ89DRAFT_322683 [Hymenopellis radicata]|nr:hypothetical protein BDZ89DRAFT_322683 [Hymenopellis radicata]
MPQQTVTYEIEVILAVRGRLKYKTPEYFVKWHGYPDSENSWEPPSSFKPDDFVKSFLEVELDPQWIKQRTHYFYQVFKNGKTSCSSPVLSHSPTQPSLKRKRDQSEPEKQKRPSLVIKLPAVKAPESSSSKSIDSFMTEKTSEGSDTDTPLFPNCEKGTADPQ